MSRGATARLFAAVDPPPAVCEALAAWAREAAAVSSFAPAGARRPPRLVDAEALHLTLCFLGSRPVGEIEALAAALGSCGGQLGELSVGAPLWLPPSRPHAIAVEIHDRDGDLARLQQTVARELSRASGWEPERRRFRAHITVIRMGSGTAPTRRVGGLGPPLPATPRLRFTPESVVLYRSWLAPTGATYEAVATCGLKAGGR
jgi:2'-5' RNA ligase